MGPCAQEDRIERIEQAIESVEKQVGLIVSEVTALRALVTDKMKMVDDHQSVLYGGNGQSGMVSEMDTLKELNLALKGYGQEPGLIAVIKQLAGKMDGIDETKKWAILLVLGTLMAQILGLILK